MSTFVSCEVRHSTVRAIAGEKAIMEWKRAWKPELIERLSRAWRDLYEEIV